ncbi:hypothetical protein [Streptomyces sp. NPDC046909]|uniref:hypothetical protein n=1 Tax=Streptomyces sp. NPDC046909 TaxID=3155617 RepID=UPI0033E494E6
MSSQPELMRGPTGGQLSDSSRRQALSDFLRREQPLENVVGFGHGVKWTGGEPTGRQAVLVFVTQKAPQSMLRERDVIPSEMDDGTPTDVVAVGSVTAQPQPSAAGVTYAPGNGAAEQSTRLSSALLEELIRPSASETQQLIRRLRPCPSGFSVGNVRVTAGTLGSVVYDLLPGATLDPPGPGLGAPSGFYILSNNHILADSNRAQLGSVIVQPGPADGGTDPGDRIATLSRFVPITFAPTVPLDQHNNLVDAALGAVSFQDATRDQYFSGVPRAWRRKANVAVGDQVKKTGRTTDITFGRIVAVDTTIDVTYPTIGVARFRDQIVTTNMSAGGDSGSLVTSYDNVAVGLLFAGSSTMTIVNHLEHVRRLLGVEIAEQLA